jgi:hypothetical protein
MKFKSIVGLCSLLLAACSSAGNDGEPASTGDEIVRPTQIGGRKEVVLIYGKAINSNGGVSTFLCSGSYFAPRVVLTAAHCLQNAWAGQVFVYYGTNFEADKALLTPQGDTFIPPPTSQTSPWAMADSYELHPAWDPAAYYPDMAVIYLDRKPPFDPLPLGRFRLDNTWINKNLTISGWGHNVATGPVTATGAGTLRTGIMKFLGSPTIADYHEDDPNPGILNPTARNNIGKLDGHPPNSSGCFGDSGGPILATQWGQTYISGVNYWGGFYCEDYSLFTRIDPFLPFLDNAYKKGGQETLIPKLECVAPNPSGSYTAYFGYNNKNGVSITIPYGTKNQLALDTYSQRPTKFLPGTHSWAFGVDFAANQTLTYKLSPDNSPTTTISVTKNSTPCGPAQADQVECGNYCRAPLHSGCSGLPSNESCIADCLYFGDIIESYYPTCVDEDDALNACVAAVPPGTPANWTCNGDGFLPSAPSCADEEAAWFNCLYYYGT